MSKAKFRANASEVNKAPDTIRYIWVLVLEDGRVITSTTFQTLNRTKGQPIEKIHLIDSSKNLLYVWEKPTEELYVNLMNLWRDNYFNPDWDISTI